MTKLSISVAGIAFDNTLDQRLIHRHVVQLFPKLEDLPSLNVFGGPVESNIEAGYNNGPPYLQVISSRQPQPPAPILNALLDTIQPILLVTPDGTVMRYTLYHLSMAAMGIGNRQAALSIYNNSALDISNAQFRLNADIYPDDLQQFASITERRQNIQKLSQ